MINVLEMLESTAHRFPGKTAFKDTDKSISFKDLTDISKRISTLFLAGSLCEPLKAGSPVGFYMEKSVDALCIMFGAVYAGGFYSFIDVRQPVARALDVINILEPVILVTDAENINGAKELLDKNPHKIKLVDKDELLKMAGRTKISESLLSGASAGFYDMMPLYVNFTSGSTGTPKGVAVSHRSVIDFTEVFTKTFDINENDILANQAPFDFDVSVKDIYSGLFTGAQVLLVPRDYFSNPSVLMDYIADNNVTVLIWAVSALCFVSIMNGLDYRTPETIEKVMFSGEVMPVKQLNKWKRYLPSATYVNLYGPTEITCNCTYFILDKEYERDGEIPAGIPFKNEKVFLLDDDDREVTEAGKEGEICVSGTCLALGYYKDKERTDAVFTQNPVNNSFYERIYRTGDIGKYDDDGNLLYVSRKDFQIKHMGQRIELGEIEASGASVDGVTRTCCIYDEKKKRIVLFYTGNVDKNEVHEGLLKRLPQFMMPGKTVQLEEFPLNKNGKIDRNLLRDKI